MWFAEISELSLVLTGPSNMQRCCAFPFALAGLFFNCKQNYLVTFFLLQCFACCKLLTVRQICASFKHSWCRGSKIYAVCSVRDWHSFVINMCDSGPARCAWMWWLQWRILDQAHISITSSCRHNIAFHWLVPHVRCIHHHQSDVLASALLCW